ncbi:MAG: UDP-N-acetylmuramoyl-L-alanyl-D-glutamate--2,6-diaminopimelate ligase, partial [Kiritimatiellae bacterium]|nr:UDP-N-acetylmuramoyl-L-alanyl-D-glutamate--2,6-diaminopimelate ligase [Kiritimatiellia bacterium]
DPSGTRRFFVDYAHTDDALSNVLSALRPVTPGRLICLFGCGGDRDRTKRPRMAAAAARLADVLVLTSDNPRTEDPLAILADIQAGLPSPCPVPVHVEPDRAAALALAVSLSRPGDTLLVAGKGHEAYQEIHGILHPFSDAAVLSALLS